ncbi:MAG TPA: hypothetical protein DEP53_20470, partial [Bacteroidetes bacterium]|nr:hypothetical protein [Bacteroidota bacterium]
HTRIVATRAGFGNDTAAITLIPGIDTTIALRVKADSASPSGTTSSNGAANIVLISMSTDNVSIRGTGANETTVLLFEVRDSLGVPIGGVNKLKVDFAILGGPGGEEYVFPVSGETDLLTGRVGTRVTAGKKAGVLQVVASGTVPGTTKVIKSSPVKITISGGLPVAERFSLSRLPMNIAGGVYDNLRASIMVIVGDKEGNPVQAGTAVSFTTTGGIIQPNAVTDKDGIATVALISGNPRPENSVAIVTAKTIGDSGVVIQKSIAVLFSGPTRILTPSTTVVVPDSGTATFEYRVQDPNGFPLVAGTSIALTVEGPGADELTLFGDVTKTLEDSNDPSTTLFKATVRDKKLKGANGSITFKIAVNSPNGNFSTTFPGFVLADTNAVPPIFGPSTSQSGYASSLTLLGVSAQEISVTGTGAVETTRLTFVAKDSVGTAVEIRKRAYVTFSITPSGGIGGGEFLFPTADSTDASGQVSTTFNAGNRAGVVQIVARANVSGRIIQSTPVRLTIFGGLPDLAHFTASLSRVNMSGWREEPGTVGTVSVQVGDKFGNPVQPGTALYFTTTGGLVQASARTDALGGATVGLMGGNPFPSDGGLAGMGHVTVHTVGEGGVSIQKDIPFLFSGAPRVALSNVPNDTVKIFDGASFDVDYVVADVNGNPLSQGHTISVTASGQGAGGLLLSGDVNVLTPDTQDKTNFTRYRFRIADNVSNGGPSGEFAISVTVSGESGTIVRKFYGILYSPQVSTTVPPSARRPAQIAFLGITNSDLYVAGVGNVENAVITYEVRDSLGVPIDRSQKAYAQYGLVFEPNGFTGGGTRPLVIPGADSTDDSGKLRASIVSGTQAGVVTIVTRIALAGGITIQSQPVKLTVHAGFADQAHFTLIPSRYSFGTVSSSSGIGFSVAVGDTFSNPVQTNTAIYFNSQAGIMTTGTTSGGTYTDRQGLASASLLTVNPRPSAVPYTYVPTPTDPYYSEMGGVVGVSNPRKGYFWVWATTQGRSGKRVGDSVLVCWNQGSIVVTGLPPAATVIVPSHLSSAPISFSVTDGNGNPLCVGTTITPTIRYTTDVSGVAFSVSGAYFTTNSPFTMDNSPGSRFPGAGTTDFTFTVNDLSVPSANTVGQGLTVELVITSPDFGQRNISFNCVVQ